jgi:hypothetical protein
MAPFDEFLARMCIEEMARPNQKILLEEKELGIENVAMLQCWKLREIILSK